MTGHLVFSTTTINGLTGAKLVNVVLNSTNYNPGTVVDFGANSNVKAFIPPLIAKVEGRKSKAVLVVLNSTSSKKALPLAGFKIGLFAVST